MLLLYRFGKITTMLKMCTLRYFMTQNEMIQIICFILVKKKFLGVFALSTFCLYFAQFLSQFKGKFKRDFTLEKQYGVQGYLD